MTLAETDVVILCGGKATRLGLLSRQTPKCLQLINGKPFLELLLADLQRHGATRVLLVAGHLWQKVADWLTERHDDLEITLCVEEAPQGTARALRTFRSLMRSKRVLVCNGDTRVFSDLDAFLADPAEVVELHCRLFGWKNTKHSGMTLWSQAALTELTLSDEVDLTRWLRWRAKKLILKGWFYDIGAPHLLRRAQKIFEGWPT